jgi:hypothetical protein
MLREPSKILCFCLLFAATMVWAQQTPVLDSLSISTKELPKASLWEPYVANMQASGGIEPYHWHVIAGSLPRGFVVNEGGTLTGVLDEPGEYEFTVLVTDNNKPPKQGKQQLVLSAETPMTAEWRRKAQVNGQRIDGSIKVSNHTGRDFDLTFVVLAVNDIGRATAIGYQHFSLKKDTRDTEIPFGDTLSPGNYAVNVDVVGEEPISHRIFRARLVTGKESITQGP